MYKPLSHRRITQILLLGSILLLLLQHLTFIGPESYVYQGYTESILKDGDLNLVNEYHYPGNSFSYTKSLNIPDFHNHGGVLVWAPARATGETLYEYKIVRRVLRNWEPNRVIQACLSLTTWFCAIVTIILSYYLCLSLCSPGSSLLSIILFYVGTPFFYYTLLKPGNANCVAAAFGAFSIIYAYQALDKRILSWLIYGLLFGVCVAVKVDLVFQSVFIACLFGCMLFSGWTRLVHGIAFLGGLGVMLVLRGVNDYIRYGGFTYGEAGLAQNGHHFFEQLFSSYRGYFYSSPIYYFSIAGFLWLIWHLFRRPAVAASPEVDFDQRRRVFFACFGISVAIKLIAMGIRLNWSGGTFGGRSFISEFPFYAVGLAYLFDQARGWKRKIVYAGAAVAVAFNLYVWTEFDRGVDMTYLTQAPHWGRRIHESLSYILSQVTYYFSHEGRDEFRFKGSVLILIVAVQLFGWVYRRILKHPRLRASAWMDHTQTPSDSLKKIRFFYAVSIVFALGYLAVTAANARNNSRNAAALEKAGYFKNATLVTDPKDLIAYENYSSLDELESYYHWIGEFEKEAEVRRQKISVYGDKRPNPP